MRYECLIHKDTKRFVVARPEGWQWGRMEGPPQFEIGYTDDCEVGMFDRGVRINWSGGVMEVRARDVYRSMVDEQAWTQEQRFDLMNKRRLNEGVMWTANDLMAAVGR